MTLGPPVMRSKESIRASNRSKRLVANGKCASCGRPLDNGLSYRCRACLDVKNTSRRRHTKRLQSLGIRPTRHDRATRRRQPKMAMRRAFYSLGCAVCGLIDPKEYGVIQAAHIYKGTHRPRGSRMGAAELRKCVPLCAIHHRVLDGIARRESGKFIPANSKKALRWLRMHMNGNANPHHVKLINGALAQYNTKEK